MQAPDRALHFASQRFPFGARWIFLCGVIVFIVYGSLFPFNFVDAPQPVSRFYENWNLFRNTSDAIDNFFLFVPMGIAISVCYTTRKARLVAATLLMLVLAVGVQLVQLYLPGRVSSVTDSIWNVLGTASGMLIASAVWHRIRPHLLSTHGDHDRFAIMLILLWLTYESYPFVPTLDIGLLKTHVKSFVLEGGFDFSRFFQHAGAALIAGVAVVRARLLVSHGKSVLLMACIAVFLEIFVAYGSLRRETLLAIGVGLGLGYAIQVHLAKWGRAIVLVAAFCALAYSVVTPYRGQPLDASFTLTPFSSFLWNTNTKDIPPMAFESLAIGGMLLAALWRNEGVARKQVLGISAVLAVVVAMEVFRVLVMSIRGDTTAVLVALLLGLAAASLRNQSATQMSSSPDEGQKSSQPLTPLTPLTRRTNVRHYLAARGLYWAAVAAFIVYLGCAGIEKNATPSSIVLWSLGLTFLFAAYRFPIIGLFVFIMIGYGIPPNDGQQYDIFLSLRLMDGIAFLALAATIVSALRTLDAQQWRHPGSYGAFAFFGWLALCLAIAIATGTPWGPVLRFDPSTYLQAALMFLVSAAVLREKSDYLAVATVIVVAVLVRVIATGADGLYLESYSGTLLVMALPLCGLGFSTAINRNLALKLACGLIACAMFGYLLVTQNRNSAVAAVVVVLFGIYQLRTAWWKKTALVVLAGLLTVGVTPDHYQNRFRALWSPQMTHKTASLDSSTAAQRLQLWDVAWKISKEHPVIGIGPGNFAHVLKTYLPSAGRQGAHNSYLQVLAEAGWPGLVLYLIFFAIAFVTLNRIRNADTQGWRGSLARWLQLTLIAYLALGIFNNRNFLVLAYIIAGATVALDFSRLSRGILPTKLEPHAVTKTRNAIN
jgi:VanZ family protein